MSEFDDSQSELLSFNKQNSESNSLFAVSELFVGLITNGFPDTGCLRSPTSPLQIRVCSHTTDHINKSARCRNCHKFNMGCKKVGLSIVDSLDENMNQSGEIVFGPAMRIKFSKNQISSTDSFQGAKLDPKGCCPVFNQTRIKNSVFDPKTQIKNSFSDQTQIKNSSVEEKPGVVFEIGENPSELEAFELKHGSCSIDSSWSSLAGTDFSNLGSGNTFLNASMAVSLSESNLKNSIPDRVSDSKLKLISGCIGSGHGFIDSASASEVELSEDYTCVISCGPNPKTTHILCDRVLERHDDEFNCLSQKGKTQIPTWPAGKKSMPVFPSNDFLSFCDFCNKKLETGEDIYMYRGEKAFCSLDCRSEVILMDMETDEAAAVDNSRNNS